MLFYTPVGLVMQQNPGSFYRKHFEAIVDQARSMAPPAGEPLLLRLDDPRDPKSLRKLKPGETFDRGQGAGNVWAELTAVGKLKVVIETRDLGHAGEYGFAYSDVPLEPRPFGEDWFTLDVPGRINIVQPHMKIDDHWWKVLNNLD